MKMKSIFLSLQLLVFLNVKIITGQYTTVTSSDGQYIAIYTGGSNEIHWDAAESYCNSVYSSNLASVHSYSDVISLWNTVLMITGSSLDTWIGLNDIASEGTFVWSDGSTVDYTAWLDGEPNDLASSEDCACIGWHSNYQWNDFPCDSVLVYTFVCNSGPTPQPTLKPTKTPSKDPTYIPTSVPTNGPTMNPTISPTVTPSNAPSNEPSMAPSIAPSVVPSLAPTVEPTIAPTIAPSIAPTLAPTIEPTIAPTDDPTIIPTSIPTTIPSNNPSNIPSYIPSYIPSSDPSFLVSETPVDGIIPDATDMHTLSTQYSTYTYTITSDIDGNDNSVDITSKTRTENGLSETTLLGLTAIVAFTLIICFCIIAFIMFGCWKQRRKEKSQKQIQLSHLSRSRRSASSTLNGKLSNTNSNRSVDIVLSDQPKINENNINTNTAGGVDPIGFGELQLASLDDISVNTVNNNSNELESEGMNSNVTIANHSNQNIYEKWDQKEVLKWIKINMLKNGIDNNKIESFLNEFSDKYVTGPMLTQLKNNLQLIDELKIQFSKQNQTFGIWLVVKSAILSLDDANVNVENTTD